MTQSVDERATQLYVRRRGRFTRGQARAMAHLAPVYVLDSAASLPGDTFNRQGAFGIEIGFGMGQALLDWSAQHPGWNFLGVDVYEPGVGSLLLGIEARELSNVRILVKPAEDVLTQNVAPGSVDEIRILFPDPWPKKRHARRRLLQPAFIELAASCLKQDGLLRVATDWAPYAEEIRANLESCALLTACPETMASPRVETRFEQRGHRLGHAVAEFLYRRCRSAA